MATVVEILDALELRYDTQIEKNSIADLQKAIERSRAEKAIEKKSKIATARGTSGGGSGGSGITQSQVKLAIESAINLANILDALITPAEVRSAIDASIDIDTIVTKLTNLDDSKLTQSGVEAAIQNAADINTIIAKLTDISNNISSISGGSSVITTMTPGSNVITDTIGTILVANINRKYAAIVNKSTTDYVALYFGFNGSFSSGLPLAPGQSYEINSANLFKGNINAIADTGITVNLATVEGV